MKKYISYYGIVGEKRTERHKTRKGAEEESVELMKKFNIFGYYIKEEVEPGVSWKRLPE